MAETTVNGSLPLIRVKMTSRGVPVRRPADEEPDDGWEAALQFALPLSTLPGRDILVMSTSK